MRHFEHNPRRITDAQLDRLKATLVELGDLGGVVHDLNSDQVVGGNQRIDAMNLAGAVPTITQTFDPPTPQGTVASGYLEYAGERFGYRAVRWTREQCQRANIVANAAGGSWDWQILADSFDPAMLIDAGLDADALKAMQTDADALGKMLAVELQAETADVGELVDRAAELQEKWQVKRGDLWTIESNSCLGKQHRILCGDSTNAEDVARLTVGEKAGLMVTDPPYAVDYVAKAKDMNRRGYVHSRAKRGAAIAGDELSEEQCSEIWLKAFTLARDIALSEHAAWYVWHAVRATRTFYDVLDSLGILYHQEIIWVKQNFVIGRSDYQWKHEPCFYGWVKGNRPPFLGDKSQTTIWQIDRDANNKPDHPTQKPIACFLPQMTNHLKVGEIAYDPFAGIAPLLVACEQTGRIGRGMEIEPKYVAVSLERLSALGLTCERIAA